MLAPGVEDGVPLYIMLHAIKIFQDKYVLLECEG